ncbi:hypothetical protein [Erwinia pyrifoliae]|uniref:Uncharacterized protein n=1 Tax=Erwinia pyrifoliae TaxID=79967 RepID=A0ABY5X9V9_ERWPY|nr:hypothetical protein [Erwinia pyrifoliae]AUX71703.1 hypothetical protein CPI84_03885 [Erwinia pyrifoliae]MCA8878070.1 hypothetical protein [Erwinia pyrifoliae]UWS34183.1 hypothetical protein NYP84_02995 [Erwinia pyrifoliae]UXK13023.1 hypothetical protein NYP80_03845 [Erwinia pyrifoliae]UXK13032.1 hypothetical protein NYP80_03895 [Erwinia pyrifoliae]
MKLPKTVGIHLFILLNLYCIITIFCAVFLVRGGIELIHYLNSDMSNLNLTEALFKSVKTGLATGIPTGTGIWFLSKIKEQKKQSPPSNPE